VLLTGSQIYTDESNITGEALHQEKHPISSLEEATCKTDPFLVGGSTVMNGTGVAVVCAVGKNSVSGKIESLMVDDDSKTPLQAKLSVIADQIGKVGVYCAVLTVVACIVNLAISKILNNEAFFSAATMSSLV
jgi:Ca2+ transporting ATPase